MPGLRMQKIDSVKPCLKRASEDTVKVNILLDLSKRLYSLEPERIHPVRKPGKRLGRKIRFQKRRCLCIEKYWAGLLYQREILFNDVASTRNNRNIPFGIIGRPIFFNA